MIKLIDILKEVGDTSNMKPYYYETVIDEESQRKYNFETDTTPPTWYEVTINEIVPTEPFSDEPIRADIAFGVTDEEGHIHYRAVTNKGELYRVMATIVDIVKKDIKTRPYIKVISFEPAKKKDEGGNIRGQLYAKYIKHAIPQAHISVKGGTVFAKIK
jgi:hypothetical protein